MQDITVLPTQRISDEQHKLALRLLRELEDTRETGEIIIPERRKFRLFPFLFANSQKLPTRQLPTPPATAQEPLSQAKPSRPYVLIPVPVRTNTPYAEAILKLYPRSYKHVYLLIDGKRSIAAIAFIKRQLGEEGIAYIVEQLEKDGIVKVTHRVESRTEKQR